MKYQPGDDILILHTKEEGKIVEIINKNMLLVEVKGVQFPVYKDQVDFPYFHRFTQKKIVETKPQKKYIDNIPKEKNIKPVAAKAEGVWVSLVPKFSFDEFNDEVVDYFKIYLINKNDEPYNFIYEQSFTNEIAFDLKGQVAAHHDFYLHDISFESLNDSPFLSVEFTLTNQDKKRAPYFETFLKLQGKKVFKQVEEMKEKNEPTLNYKLFDVYPLMEKDFMPYYENAKHKTSLQNNNTAPRSVIDLHIEKLTENYKSMSSFEILHMQLKEFEKWYNITVQHMLPNLIVVHGVGSGKLKDEIHEILKSKKEVKTFINQYHPLFGFGATEIFFKY